MDSNRKEQIELAIWKEVAGENLSVSHDRWHIDRVLSFAYQLQSIYGGDLEVITAAVILHDLGRSDPNLHGQDSIEKSIARACRILERASFPSDKIKQVITAIDEHDKPEVRPSTVEGRILKDADFLGGFGAWGILRVGMWAGESGRRVGQVLESLEHRMPKRLESLEFPESVGWAQRETLFVKAFLSILKQEPLLPKTLPKGKYILLEGNSGSGKDTQATILKEHLERQGYKVAKVAEPGDDYKAIRDLLERMYGEPLEDPLLRRFLFMADRYRLIKEEVRPTLEKGDIVLSVRSFISTLVYQCEDEQDIPLVAYMHQFVPTPDLLLLYDLDANAATRRIEDRDKERSRYENRYDLARHRERYLRICQCRLIDCPVRIIDASKSIEEVATETWNAVSNIISD